MRKLELKRYAAVVLVMGCLSIAASNASAVPFDGLGKIAAASSSPPIQVRSYRHGYHGGRGYGHYRHYRGHGYHGYRHYGYRHYRHRYAHNHYYHGGWPLGLFLSAPFFAGDCY